MLLFCLREFITSSAISFLPYPDLGTHSSSMPGPIPMTRCLADFRTDQTSQTSQIESTYSKDQSDWVNISSQLLHTSNNPPIYIPHIVMGHDGSWWVNMGWRSTSARLGRLWWTNSHIWTRTRLSHAAGLGGAAELSDFWVERRSNTENPSSLLSRWLVGSRANVLAPTLNQ